MDKVKASYITTAWSKGTYSYNMCKVNKKSSIPEQFQTSHNNVYCFKGDSLPKEDAEYYGS